MYVKWDIEYNEKYETWDVFLDSEFRGAYSTREDANESICAYGGILMDINRSYGVNALGGTA